jgi:hypothetical protein
MKKVIFNAFIFVFTFLTVISFGANQANAFWGWNYPTYPQYPGYQNNAYYSPYYNNNFSPFYRPTYYYNWNWSNNNYQNQQSEVFTVTADDIDGDSAILNGTINNPDTYSYIWFEYGENPNSLNNTTSRERVDYNNRDFEFSSRISNLNYNQRYFYRAVLQNNYGVSYGATLNFITNDDYNNHNNNNEDYYEPEAQTTDVYDITEESAVLEGEVDMNDFDNGIVFFVYGEDDNQVEDISDDYNTYNEIDEDGDYLQKVKVDSGLDGDDSYTFEISNLNDDTDYYYSMCVSYENEDGDDRIICGDTESFTTDEY